MQDDTIVVPRSLRVEISEGIATLTLERPESLNALTMETFRDLRDTFRSFQDDPFGAPSGGSPADAVRAVILTGAGSGFCSGADIDDLLGKVTRMGNADTLAFIHLGSEMILAMRRLRKPIIAAVNGVAVGAGAALALASDIRIASDLARFGFIFARIGLSAAEMGVTWMLPRIVGMGRASELLLGGEIIDAPTAERYGLVNRIVPADQLLATAREFARKLVTGPTFAHGMTKEMLERESQMDLESALAAESQAQQICSQSIDFREAYRALVRRRRPRFQGR